MADRWPFDWSPPARATTPGPDAGERAATALAPLVAEALRAATPGLVSLGAACRTAMGALSALARSVPPEEDDRG